MYGDDNKQLLPQKDNATQWMTSTHFIKSNGSISEDSRSLHGKFRGYLSDDSNRENSASYYCPSIKTDTALGDAQLTYAVNTAKTGWINTSYYYRRSTETSIYNLSMAD
jgi:hypothetical protein